MLFAAVSDDDARRVEKLLRGEQWLGDGLPPVGTECEVNSPKYGWIKATVTAVTDNFLIVQYPDTVEYSIPHRLMEDDGTFTVHHDRFRPLRTERDKAVEQIDNITGVFANTCISEQLYDAIVAGKIDGLGKVG